MYADDSYSYVQKDEMDRLVLESEGQVSSALSDLFQEVIVCEVLNVKHYNILFILGCHYCYEGLRFGPLRTTHAF